MTTTNIIGTSILNPMTLIDGYKFSHRAQYPQKTTKIYSNWTPRGSRILGQKEVVFFGLQYFIQKYLVDDMKTGFFDVPKDIAVKQYANRINSYLGPDNNVGTEHIAALHDLGYVPLRFDALPEGSRCSLRVPMLTVENTHPDFAWMVNYVETLMSATLWLPCTSATTAMRYRNYLNEVCEKSGGDKSFVGWQGHDFSMRGMAGLEAACLSGAAHLLSFTGTDTVPALDFIEHYYPTLSFLGASVPASEHSTVCAGGKESEQETFSRFLDIYPTGIVSIVSDTWDFFGVLTKILPALKSKIMSRNGKLVIRPDSGDPVKIICGDPNSTVEHVRKGAIELLWDEFGGTVNAKGFKVLDPHVGLIYGDAITFERCQSIVEGLLEKGFASTNVVFGIGSFTYNYVTRDTFGFAMKATWAEIDGVGQNLFKKPLTDTGEKFSATGRMSVVKTADGYSVIEKATPEQEANSCLKMVWKDGEFARKVGFDEVRRNLWNNS